jgi:ABC-type uncharacterized transport system permease subunit
MQKNGSIPLKSRMRQIYPLLLLSFTVVLDFLARAIRQRKKEK